MFALMAMILSNLTGGKVKVWHVLVAWIIFAIIGLALLGGAAYVAVHFIVKFW